ncbi:MAG: hypothetical protein ABI778_06895 [Ignavibacteriota bacterium]
MNNAGAHITPGDFFSSSANALVKESDLLRRIIGAIPPDSAEFYDLTFHAAFAKRIFDIIKREGPHTLGFERMQQSFFESVEKIKGILQDLGSEHPDLAAEFTPPTPEAKAKLSRIIEDLALVKNWLVAQEKK